MIRQGLMLAVFASHLFTIRSCEMSNTRLYGLPSPTPAQFNAASEKVLGKGALIWTDANSNKLPEADELAGSQAAQYVAQNKFTPGFEKLFRDVAEVVRQESVKKELSYTYRMPIVTHLGNALKAMPKSIGLTGAEIALYKRGVAKLMEVAPLMQTVFELQVGFTPDMRAAIKTADDQELVARYGYPGCIGDTQEICTALSSFAPLRSGMVSDDIECPKEVATSTTGLGNPFSVTIREGGQIKNTPFATAYAAQLQPASAKLREAAEIFAKVPREKVFAQYLNQLADDFGNTEPFPFVKSDALWIAQKSTPSIMFARIGPDENGNLGVTGDKCEAKAKFHFAIGLINADFIKTAEALRPDFQGMEDTYAALVGDPKLYTAQKAVVSPPDLVDIIYSNGDDRGGATGSSAAQTLPNWCGADGNQSPCPRRTMIFGNKTNLSYSKEIMAQYVVPLFHPSVRPLFDYKLGFESMGLHELHHNMGPQPGKLRPGSSVNYEAALGKWGHTFEEFKAEYGALIYPTQKYVAAVAAHKDGKLSDKALKNAEDYYQAQMMAILAWGFRHIAKATHSGKFDGVTAYSKLSFPMLGVLVDNGALEFDAATRTWKPDFDKFPSAVETLGRTLLGQYAKGDAKATDAFMTYWIYGDGFNKLHIDRLQELAGKMPSAQFMYEISDIVPTRKVKPAKHH